MGPPYLAVSAVSNLLLIDITCATAHKTKKMEEVMLLPVEYCGTCLAPVLPTALFLPNELSLIVSSYLTEKGRACERCTEIQRAKKRRSYRIMSFTWQVAFSILAAFNTYFATRAFTSFVLSSVGGMFLISSGMLETARCCILLQAVKKGRCCSGLPSRCRSRSCVLMLVLFWISLIFFDFVYGTLLLVWEAHIGPKDAIVGGAFVGAACFNLISLVYVRLEYSLLLAREPAETPVTPLSSNLR